MALDFHKAATNEYLFGLDDSQYAHIETILIVFKNQSGILIDPYKDTKLTVGNQKAILRIIDDYINTTDLNMDKKKTVDIIEFRALINYFLDKKIDIKILGD